MPNSAMNQIQALAISDTAYESSWDGVTGVAPSKNAVYDKIQLISALFPAALGAANLKQFMDAAGTAAEWATGSYSGTFTRAMDAASGDVAYTGVGFKPSAIIIIATLVAKSYSVGLATAGRSCAILVFGASAAAIKAAREEKAQAFLDNLPSWAAVKTAIEGATTTAALRIIVLKLARVVYWLARDKAD